MWSNKEEAACAKSQGQTHLNANLNNRSARRMCGLTTTYKWNHLPPYSWSSWTVYRNTLRTKLPNIKRWYSHKRDNKSQLSGGRSNSDSGKRLLRKEENTSYSCTVLCCLHVCWLIACANTYHLLISDFSDQAPGQAMRKPAGKDEAEENHIRNAVGAGARHRESIQLKLSYAISLCQTCFFEDLSNMQKTYSTIKHKFHI